MQISPVMCETEKRHKVKLCLKTTNAELVFFCCFFKAILIGIMTAGLVEIQ